MNFKGKGRKNNGITLIALVITIIVLLILAGVTIMTLMGSENAPQKASEAVEKDAIAGAKDEVAMEAQSAILDYYNKKYVEGNETEEKSIQEVVSEAASTAVENAKTRNNQLLNSSGVNEDYTITLKTKSYTVTGTIDEKGGITWSDTVTSTVTPNESFNPEDITIGEAIHPEDYGRKVNGYTADNKTWRLFYQDKNYTYIICNELIDLNQSLEEYYKAGDYADGSKVGPIGQNLNPMLKENGKFFISDNDNPSIRAVAWLTDPDVWNTEYLQEDSGAVYAIGGPTSELFRASFNATIPYNIGAEEMEKYSLLWPYGYDELSDTTHQESFKNQYSGGIYRKGNSKFWWLASPFGDEWDNGDLVGCVHEDYGCSSNAQTFHKESCVRPLVCIPTSVFEGEYQNKLEVKDW